MSAMVVISKEGTRMDLSTLNIWLKGVVLETKMTVSKHKPLLTASASQLARPAGCHALTSTTPSTNGESINNRRARNSSGSRLNNTVNNNTPATPANQARCSIGISTVATMRSSANPSLGAAPKRWIGLPGRP